MRASGYLPASCDRATRRHCREIGRFFSAPGGEAASHFRPNIARQCVRELELSRPFRRIPARCGSRYAGIRLRSRRQSGVWRSGFRPRGERRALPEFGGGVPLGSIGGPRFSPGRTGTSSGGNRGRCQIGRAILRRFGLLRTRRGRRLRPPSSRRQPRLAETPESRPGGARGTPCTNWTRPPFHQPGSDR